MLGLECSSARWTGTTSQPVVIRPKRESRRGSPLARCTCRRQINHDESESIERVRWESRQASGTEIR